MRARVNSCTKYTMRIVCSSSHRFISILCCSEFMCEWSNQGEFHLNNNGYSIYFNISVCISRTLCISEIWVISVKNLKYMMIIQLRLRIFLHAIIILVLSYQNFKQMHNMYPHLLPLSPFDVLFICLVLLVHLAIAKALHFSPSESIKQERPPHRLADLRHPCDYKIVF